MKAVKSRGGLTHGRGMSESVRITWVKTMHKCATVHVAVTNLAELDIQISELPHAEMGRARLKRDFEDLNRIVSWFDARDPFSVPDVRLQSLSSGISVGSEDGINCDDAGSVGAAIMMDNVAFCDVVLKKSAEARSLADIGIQLIGGNKKLPLDSTVLF